MSKTEAETKIMSLASQGMSQNKIAKELNRLGYRTVRGTTWKQSGVSKVYRSSDKRTTTPTFTATRTNTRATAAAKTKETTDTTSSGANVIRTILMSEYLSSDAKVELLKRSLN